MKRLLVTGSRDWTDIHVAHTVLTNAVDELGVKPWEVVLVHGGADGLDTIADEWATAFSVPVEVYPYPKLLKAMGGPWRDKYMVGLGADLCLAFGLACTRKDCGMTIKPHFTHGAKYCAETAEQFDIETRRYHVAKMLWSQIPIGSTVLGADGKEWELAGVDVSTRTVWMQRVSDGFQWSGTPQAGEAEVLRSPDQVAHVAAKAAREVMGATVIEGPFQLPQMEAAVFGHPGSRRAHLLIFHGTPAPEVPDEQLIAYHASLDHQAAEVAHQHQVSS